MKIYINKRELARVFLYVYLFLFFYFPKFISSSSILFTQQIVYFIVMVLLIPYIRYSSNVYPEIYRSKRVWIYCALIGMAAIYYLFRYSIANNQFNLADSRVLQNTFPIIVIVNMMVVFSVMKKWGFTREEGIDLILKLASFQGIVSFIMLVWEPAKEIANTLYLNYATQFKAGDYILSTRVYGISSDYTYGMPIIHGLLCGISLYIALSKERKYFWYTAFIFFNVFLNGRTGLLVAMIAAIVAIIFYLNGRHFAKTSMFILIILPFIVMLFALYMYKYQASIFNFMAVLFNELYGLFFEQKTVGTINYLLNTNFYLPEGLDFLFGEGHRVYGEEARKWGNLSTDVGIVNDMFMGGLVFVVVRYGAMVKLVTSVDKNKYNNLIVVLMLITWIIADIKGQVTVNPIIIGMYIYIVFCLYFLQKEVE